MDLKKAGAYILVTVMSSPLIVWAGSQILLVSTHGERIKTLEEKISSIEDDVKEVHWFLIKRNNVKVPEKIK